MSLNTVNKNMKSRTYSKLLLNVPSKDFDRMETLIKAGEFTTKSDLIRFAIKQLLYSEERMKEFDRLSTKLQEQTKRMGLTKKDVLREVEEAKEETRRDVRKMMRDIEKKRRREKKKK